MNKLAVRIHQTNNQAPSIYLSDVLYIRYVIGSALTMMMMMTTGCHSNRKRQIGRQLKIRTQLHREKVLDATTTTTTSSSYINICVCKLGAGLVFKSFFSSSFSSTSFYCLPTLTPTDRPPSPLLHLQSRHPLISLSLSVILYKTYVFLTVLPMRK